MCDNPSERSSVSPHHSSSSRVSSKRGNTSLRDQDVPPELPLDEFNRTFLNTGLADLQDMVKSSETLYNRFKDSLVTDCDRLSGLLQLLNELGRIYQGWHPSLLCTTTLIILHRTLQHSRRRLCRVYRSFTGETALPSSRFDGSTATHRYIQTSRFVLDSVTNLLCRHRHIVCNRMASRRGRSARSSPSIRPITDRTMRGGPRRAQPGAPGPSWLPIPGDLSLVLPHNVERPGFRVYLARAGLEQP